MCAYRPLGHFLLRLADKLPLLKRISPKLHEAYDALLEMTRPMPLLIGWGLAFLAWGLECGSLYVIVHRLPRRASGVGRSGVLRTRRRRWRGALAMMPGGLGGTEAVYDYVAGACSASRP